MLPFPWPHATSCSALFGKASWCSMAARWEGSDELARSISQLLEMVQRAEPVAGDGQLHGHASVVGRAVFAAAVVALADYRRGGAAGRGGRLRAAPPANRSTEL